jgi:hypothetical protein
MPLERHWLAAIVVGLLMSVPAYAEDLFAKAEFLLQTGDVVSALAVANEIVFENPNDSRALVLLGRTQIAANRPDLARATARRAWWVSRRMPDLQFDAARLGARAAADQQRFGAARIWLRLAADVASNPARRVAIAESMAAVRQMDPSSMQLSFAIIPSSNINGGSSADILIVDGIETPLALSGDARALSGLEARIDIAKSWRLSQDVGGTTLLGFRVSGAGFRLSKTAREQAPDVTGADFATATAELSLSRVISQPTHQLRYRGTLGRAWHGGSPESVRLRFDVGLVNSISPSLSSELQALIEGRVADGTQTTSTAASFSGTLNWKFRTSELATALTLTHVNAPEKPNDEYQGAALSFTYAPDPQARIIEPTITLTSSVTHFDTVLNNVFGNRGRTDLRLAIDVELELPRAERFGFVPAIAISGSRTWSNVSRFDGNEVALSFRFASSF